MKKFVKMFALAFLLLSSFVMFADGADNDSAEAQSGDNVPEGLEGSIDSNIAILALVGVSFAFYSYKKMQQQKVNA
jgi:hypothetical protein